MLFNQKNILIIEKDSIIQYNHQKPYDHSQFIKIVIPMHLSFHNVFSYSQIFPACTRHVHFTKLAEQKKINMNRVNCQHLKSPKQFT